MLLRLAAIQESRDLPASALYYLNVYQAHFPSPVVWRKMSELAHAHRITGYPDTWRQQLSLTFRRYYATLLQALLVIAVAVGTLLLSRRRKVARVWWVLYGSYVVLVLAFLNVFDAPVAGLVRRSRAVLMAAPSAAGSWVTTAAAGDRLLVQGREDIWYRVQWRGQTAYIRQHDLLLVE